VRILLTGASGFIGTPLLRTLAEQHDVHALSRRGPVAGAPDGVRWIEADLRDAGLAQRLPGELDVIVHLAQSELYRDFPGGARDVYEVNVHSTFTLLEHARRIGASRFVFASTGGVYGYNEQQVTERHPVEPLNFYLSSKYAAEVLIANYRELFHTVVLRPFFVYGPGQRGMLVATLARRVIDGAEISIDGDPGIGLNPTYVDDAVRAFAAAVTHTASGVFNVAGDESLNLRELVERLGAIAGTAPSIRHAGTSGSSALLGDNSLMREVLGVAPQTTLDEGLRRVVDELRTAAA
jgi:nucleoside-diphosphate-sugar epimerase